MKIIAYICLHYGKPYIAASIQSVIDAIDELWILYSRTPSHNGGTARLVNPDTEAELRAIAEAIAGGKLRWVSGDWRVEHQHRGAIHQLVPDADVILVLDSDEIWHPEIVESAIGVYPLAHKPKHVRVPVLEYWRSFYRAMPDAIVHPTRVLYPKGDDVSGDFPTDHFISHFGYAQPVEYIAYKWSGIHGHQAEMRKDCDWVNDVYATNRQFDCHPTSPGYWNPVTIDPWQYLPPFMKYHQYANCEVIE